VTLTFYGDCFVPYSCMALSLCCFCFISVKKPKQTTKDTNDTAPIVRRVPAPPPSEYYRRPSALDSSDYSSYNSSVSSDYTHMLHSDSSLPVPYMGGVRNSMIGVLRVNISHDDYVSDLSSDSSNSNVLNDLSSVDTSVVTSVPSMLSFKNI